MRISRLESITLTWWIEKAIGDLFVCSVVGTRLTEGRWDSVVRFHTVGQGFWQRRHFYLKKHRHKVHCKQFQGFMSYQTRAQTYINKDVKVGCKGIHKLIIKCLLVRPVGGA